MVFQFELVELASGKYGKWTDKRVPLKDFKRVMTAWQTELEGKAWNSLFLGNHDQPRCLSRFGDDSPEYRVVSAKMLATCLHMMQGTPYVYQGDELGMKNVPFHDLSEFRDIESINAFHELTGAGKVAPDDMVAHHVVRCYFSGTGQLVERVDALNIAELGQIVERNIFHAKLIALVYIRGTLHHMKAGCQHFGTYHTVFRLSLIHI